MTKGLKYINLFKLFAIAAVIIITLQVIDIYFGSYVSYGIGALILVATSIPYIRK